MPKTPVSKGSGVLLQQILDLTETLEVMKEAVNHDYSSGEPNTSLVNSYNLFQKRRYAFKTHRKQLKDKLTDKDYQDIENLISGNFDEVKDKTALLNRYSSPAYKGAVKGWSDISKAELNTVLNDDYKLQGVGGVKFTKNDKYISAMKERLANPIPLVKKEVKFVEPLKKADDGKKPKKLFTKEKKPPKATGGAKADVDEEFYYDGTQSAGEIEALSRKQKDLIKELFEVYEKQENPEKLYSKEYADLRKDSRFDGIDIDMVEKMMLLPNFKEDTKKAEKEMLRKVGEVKQAQADRREVKAVLESLVSGVEKSKEDELKQEEERSKMSNEDSDVVVEDVPNPEVVDDPNAPFIPTGIYDLDPNGSVSSADTADTATSTKTKVTISTSNTKHQDGANSEYTLGDTTQVGGTSPLNTPRGNPPDSNPYSNPVDVGAMDIEELRKRLASQPQTEEEVKKVLKTGVFKGFGTVDEEVVEEVSRTSGEIPTTPQEAVNMATGNEVAEEKARNKKDIERLKEEIRGLHKTFDILIPALREKTHQLRFKLAMASKDKKVVMKHHAEMMERVRLYFGGGQGNGLKVGVVVPLDSYMSSFFSGVNSGEGDISNITKQTQPKGEHHSRGSGGKIVAKSIYYQRGGMSAVKGQAVSGHQVPSTLIKTRRGKIADPLQVVDAPYEYVLNRKATGSTKAVSGLKIKSKK